MAEVYLALGSNVGDKKLNIEHAVELLSEKISNMKRAPVYVSKAVGYTEQDDFLNTAVCGNAELEPEDLLKFIKSVEGQVGRTRTFRWGPREIDIDIIFYGREILQTENLKIPHPEFTKRDFVLKPLVDLKPNFKDPISQKTINRLLEEIPKSEHSIINQL